MMMTRARLGWLMVSISVVIISCSPIEVGVERTVTPEQSLLATVEALEHERNLLRTQIANYGSVEVNLTAHSKPEEVRQRLAEGHERWQALMTTVRVSRPAVAGDMDIEYRLWLDKGLAGYKLWQGSLARSLGKVVVSNPTTTISFNLTTGEAQRSAGSLEGSSDGLEPLWAGVPALGRNLGPPLSNMLFPVALSQRPGEFSVVGMDRVADREAIIVEWASDEGELADRLWLDPRTGFILRWQDFGGTNELQSEMVVEELQYEPALADGEFAPSLYTIDALLADLNVPRSTPMLEGDPALMTDLYFYLRDPVRAADQVKLVRVAGSCFLASLDCPSLELIEGFPAGDQTIQPLSWSPDGSSAAVAGRGPDGGQALYLFDPTTSQWQSIAEFTRIDSPISWSASGNWLAFKADRQTEIGLYLLHPDGSDRMNITQEIEAQSSDTAFPLGWMGEQLLFQLGEGEDLELHLFDPQANETEAIEVETAFLGKPSFNPSPNGDRYLFIRQDENGGQQLILLEPSGVGQQEVVSFADQSIGPVAWTSEADRLAFAVGDFSATQAKAPSGPHHSVFLISPDGTNMQQLFSSQHVGHLAFSPSRPLLVIEGSEGFGNHLYLVNVDNGNRRLLSVPGLPLASDWLSPNWRPHGR